MIAKSFNFPECGVVSRVTNWTDSTFAPYRHPTKTFSPLCMRDNEGGFRHFHGSRPEGTSYDLVTSM